VFPANGKKLKKSPGYVAGGLERIFVVIDHKMHYIWLWLTECPNIWYLEHILDSPTFLNSSPKLKSFIFCLLEP
jgi:hypothetical protein